MMTLPIINFVLFLGAALLAGIFCGWRYFLMMAYWERLARQRAYLQREELKQEIRREMEAARAANE